MTLLKISDIRKGFKGNIVLDHIDLEVNQGECLYIHGKNG